MYQNLDGTKRNSKPILFIVALLVIAAIIGTTFFLMKPESNENLENYSQNDNKETSSSKEEKEEEKEPVVETPESPIVEVPEITTEYSNIEQISLSSFNEMIKKKRSFVVVISQTYCSHCIVYKPIYNEVLKEHNSKGYDLDIYGLSQTVRTDLLNKYGINGTPTTLIFIDGVLQKDRIEGMVEKQYLVDFLSKYGFI
ncbi:MAG: thioredoxin family protein [Firmicutes bacterium]|nr:thioredoxin family protein [Bacillota bacterium]